MNKKYVLSVIGLCCSLIFGYGQILTIVEKNDGKTDSVKANSAQIIDINGDLEIAISKTELINRIKSSHTTLGGQFDLQANIDALEEALSNQESLLEYLKEETLNPTDKKSFYTKLDSFYQALLQDGNEGLRKEANSLYNEWRVQYGPRSNNADSGIKKEVYILSNFNKALNTAKEALANSKGKSFTVSMLAYVYGRNGKNRVHIENFDSISESEIYSVPRWVTTLTSEQTAKLIGIQKRAEAYNMKAPNYFENFKAELLAEIPDLNCIINLQSDIEFFIDNAKIDSTLKSAIKEDVHNIEAGIQGLTTDMSSVKNDISNWTVETPFEIIQLVKSLTKRGEIVKNVLAKFKQTTASVVTIENEVKALTDTFTVCYDKILSDINGLTKAMGILKNQQDRFNDTDEIGSEITKFTLNDLPNKGYIKLLRSGPRKKGDDLEVVLLLRLPKDTSASDNNGNASSETNETLESRTMNMQLIGLRSETAVGIIMADSFNENKFSPVNDKRFLYAPSAALLLKVGSRKSKLYNNFIDLGFGIAVSTPDFNTDGTPEFGAGLMFTAFKDVLSLGINYNVTLDAPYWSFGINLPFNLPGIPINSLNQ